MKTYESLNQLQNIKSVCLIAHIEPDPDALSSMVVFREFLKDHFKIERVDIFAEHHGITNSLEEILGETPLNNVPCKYETAIMMDCPNTDRLGKYKSLYENTKLKFVIDHHATNNFDGDINFVENVSSTCEIIYSILRYYKYNLSSEQKGKLYAGVITDTNNFTVGTFGEQTFKMISEIIEYIDKETIYKAFLANNTLKSLKLLSLAIENIKSFNHDQIIITHITLDDATKHNANHIDMCGIVNRIATINTAKLICFIEPRDDMYYVSMRAKKNYDVSKIAKNNGGGGHVGAAAFISTQPLQEIEKLILTEFQKQCETVKPQIVKLFK